MKFKESMASLTALTWTKQMRSSEDRHWIRVVTRSHRNTTTDQVRIYVFTDEDWSVRFNTVWSVLCIYLLWNRNKVQKRKCKKWEIRGQSRSWNKDSEANLHVRYECSLPLCVNPAKFCFLFIHVGCPLFSRTVSLSLSLMAPGKVQGREMRHQ